jgi:nitrite reductase/ring-hydroxylating ferredoxin subunit
MSDAWKSYSGAPSIGAEVCTLDAIPDGNTLCLELGGYPIVLVRNASTVRAFVNACPHQYLPLNHRGDKLISADKKILRCTNHGAGFCVETGGGVEGLGIGACLDPIPVHLKDRAVCIGPML